MVYRNNILKCRNNILKCRNNILKCRNNIWKRRKILQKCRNSICNVQKRRKGLREPRLVYFILFRHFRNRKRGLISYYPAFSNFILKSHFNFQISFQNLISNFHFKISKRNLSISHSKFHTKEQLKFSFKKSIERNLVFSHLKKGT